MIYMLAEMGAHVNTMDNHGDTPLHVAVNNQQVTSANFLISLGASVNATNNDGSTPLHAAV
jgi:ankyrin repeat protein